MILERDFAGAERRFRLGYGEICDIEDGLGKVAIATVYKRMGTFDWSIRDVYHVLKRALVGGGMSLTEADRLVKQQIDDGRLGELMALAYDILLEAVEGAPEGKGGGSGAEPTPFDRGMVYKSFAEVGIPPQDVDAMDFGKALALFEAMRRDGRVGPPTPDEFAEMRARYESGALDWATQPTTKGTPGDTPADKDA